MRTFLLPLALVAALVGCGDSSDAGGNTATADGPPPPEERSGTLEDGDDTLQSGEYMDTFEVTAREGQWIRTELISGEFDPYLIIYSPTGEQTDVDDSSLGNTSMTKSIVEVTESGEWTILVTSFEPGESGAYDLTFEVLDERPGDADEGTQVDVPSDSTTDV
ncbi:MAG: hypothetical protein AAGK21_05505 [Bacteroidota bacterium]